MKTYEERTQSVRVKMEVMKSERAKRRRIITGSCMTLAVAVLALVLFIPYDTTPPRMDPYADSPYYELIQKINDATYQRPAFANLFQKLIMNGINMDMAEGAAPGQTANTGLAVPESSGDYVEVTDNQVQGVTEADLIKRSDRYIYYLRGLELSVYSIAGEESAEVGSFAISGFSGEDKDADYANFSEMYSSEMYLSQDCTTVTVLLQAYNTTVGSCTIAVSLDVTDPNAIVETGRVYVTGSYTSSRMVDGDLLLMNNFRINTNDLNFEKESTFLPQVGVPGDMHSVAAEDIVVPEELTSTRYTVICKLDGKTLQVQDTAAFLSYSDELYVSENAVYATRSFAEKKDETLTGYTTVTMTEITGVSYSGETMEMMGSVMLEGNVKNQYSMDEYEGILRVVTSTSTFQIYSYDGHSGAMTEDTQRNVNLYCVDLSDWAVVACVTGFAPEGETAESVRFDGEMAYVCTAEVVTLTDPVYFFDLSDLSNITYKDTGTIDGYSSSLIQLGDGFLLGIGYSDSRQLKIEVYEETENGVESLCAYEQYASFSEEYKSYLIDREEDLVGLLINDWNTGETQYVLLRFDGYELRQVLCVDFEGDLSNTRGVLIDGYLYLLGYGFQVEKVW